MFLTFKRKQYKKKIIKIKRKIFFIFYCPHYKIKNINFRGVSIQSPSINGYVRTYLKKKGKKIIRRNKVVFNYYWVKPPKKTKIIFAKRLQQQLKVNGYKSNKYHIQISRITKRLIKQYYIHFRHKIRSFYYLRKFKIIIKFLIEQIYFSNVNGCGY